MDLTQTPDAPDGSPESPSILCGRKDNDIALAIVHGVSVFQNHETHEDSMTKLVRLTDIPLDGVHKVRVE